MICFVFSSLMYRYIFVFYYTQLMSLSMYGGSTYANVRSLSRLAAVKSRFNTFLQVEI